MEKIALITDSSCGLFEDYLKEYDIHLLRLKILYKDKEFVEGIDISPEEVYENLGKELPTTSMPSVSDATNLLNTLFEKGYTHVIALPISSGLSGTINSIRLASENFEGKLETFIFDTKLVSMAVGIFVIEVAKLIKQGKSFKDICETIPKIREKTNIYFTVDTLEYLIKGGRIGKLSGNIGELLNLKPIIVMNEEGKYSSFAKVRGTKQALKRLIAIGEEALAKGKCFITVSCGTMIDEANILRETFSKNPNVTMVYSKTISSVIGIHSGPKAFGFAIIEEY